MASIKCGKCQGTHASVQDVRSCYAGSAKFEAQTVPPTKRVGNYRANKYAGTCVVCGSTVQPEEGFIFRSMGVGSQRHGEGEWKVQHVQGQCPVTSAEAAELKEIHGTQPHIVSSDELEEDRKHAARKPQSDFSGIPQGYYATASATGNNDLDFWFVRVPEKGRWAGYRFVKRVIGGRGNEAVRQSTAIAALRAILAAGPDVAGKVFAQELGRCRKCGRDLTDDDSRALGIGPVCRDK